MYCFEPGQEQKGHIHGEQDKVYIVLEGEGHVSGRDGKACLGSGPGNHGSGRRGTWREESQHAAFESARVCRAESREVIVPERCGDRDRSGKITFFVPFFGIPGDIEIAFRLTHDKPDSPSRNRSA